MKNGFDKEKTLRGMWAVLNEHLRCLQTITFVEETTSSTESGIWNRILDLQREMRAFKCLDIGSFFYIKEYRDDEIYFRVDGFAKKEDGWVAEINILACTLKEGEHIREAEVKAKTFMPLKEMVIADKYELVIDKLPTLLGHTFTGPLLDELIKKGKV